METEQALSSYRIFNAVAESGNISKAAKELYISQPAISKAVSKLEQSLCVKLFIRNSRGVRLTEEGALLYEHTRSAFEALKQGEENLKRINTLGIGHIKIGVSTTLCKYMLLPYLQGFIEKYPHIKITIQCQSTFQTLSLLDDGRIDIGLIGKPHQTSSIDFFEIGEMEDIFVATDTYLENLKIREQEAATCTEDILRHAYVMLLDEKNITRMYINEYFAKSGIEPGQVLEVSSMDLLIEFARIGLGVACVIKEFVADDLKTGTLKELPLSVPIQKRAVGFAYNRNHLSSDAMKHFIEFYKRKEATVHE